MSFQTGWNEQRGRSLGTSIKDYDLFYFDADHTAAQDERGVQTRVEAVLGDLGIVVEASNQARVHLWYESYFGFPYAPSIDARDGIGRFLVEGTCVGVRPDGEVHAPFGLTLLYDGLLTPNARVPHRALFNRKAESYRSRWPWLRTAVDGERAHQTQALRRYQNDSY